MLPPKSIFAGIAECCDAAFGRAVSAERQRKVAFPHARVILRIYRQYPETVQFIIALQICAVKPARSTLYRLGLYKQEMLG